MPMSREQAIILLPVAIGYAFMFSSVSLNLLENTLSEAVKARMLELHQRCYAKKKEDALL